jgi:hypothetical protein
MESDKDTFHVVIKLPFPRPNDFAEPPSVSLPLYFLSLFLSTALSHFA